MKKLPGDVESSSGSANVARKIMRIQKYLGK